MDYHYRIGDIANLLNISSEMVRYYEKKGVIKPKRDENNNYRVYSTMDVFAIHDAMQLKLFDIRLKDFNTTKSNDYTRTVISHLEKYREKLKQNIEYETMLLNRIDTLIERNETTYVNQGNFWIKSISPYYKIFLLKSHNDSYGQYETPKNILSQIYSPNVMPFVDSVVEFDNDMNRWYIVLDKRYSKCVSLSSEDSEIEEQKLCLCTIADMGEIGTFTNGCIKPLLEYAQKNGYRKAGNISGLLCSRGVDSEQYHRYLELRMPVEFV